VDVARVVPDVPGAGVQARRGGARQRGQDHHALQAPPRRGRHRRAHHRQQRRGGRLQEPALRGQLPSLLPPPLLRATVAAGSSDAVEPEVRLSIRLRIYALQVEGKGEILRLFINITSLYVQFLGRLSFSELQGDYSSCRMNNAVPEICLACVLL